MKEKTLKFMSRYLLFGVITCMIGFGAASCGDDYDDAPLKADMKTKIDKLNSDLNAVQNVLKDKADKSVVDEALETAVADVKADLAKAMGEGVTPEKMAEVMGQLNVLNDAMDGNMTAISDAVKSVNDMITALNEALPSDTRAPKNWIEMIVGYNEDITKLKVQSEILANYMKGVNPATLGTGSLQGDFDAVKKAVSDMQKQLSDNLGNPSAPGGVNASVAANIANAQIDALLESAGYSRAGVAGIKAQIEALVAKVNSLSPGTGGGVTNPDQLFILERMDGMVTGVKIVNASGMVDYKSVLTFSTIPSMADGYTFGTGYEGALTFTKGAIHPEAAASRMVVQVSPANAVLTPAMISLVNSVGGVDINSFIEVKSVAPYAKMLTRGTPATGLYEITFGLKTSAYSKEGFNAVSMTGKKPNLFAIAIASSVSETANRHVLSDYEVTTVCADGEALHTTDVNTSLDFKVGTMAVSGIKNRFDAAKEKMWSLTATSFTNTAQGTTAATADDRTSSGTYSPIELNKEFEVALTFSTRNMEKVFAYYITTDIANADNETGTPTEKALWESATIEGINKVYRTAVNPSAKITITDSRLKDKKVGFRMYAVNYDGTLVDPDGRAFYVSCGGASVTGRKLEFKTNITGYVANGGMVESHKVDIDLSGINTNAITTATLVFEDATVTLSSADLERFDEGNFAVNNWNETKKLSLKKSIVPAKLRENTSYTGTLILQNSDNNALATYDVTLRKELPTSVPDLGDMINKEQDGALLVVTYDATDPAAPVLTFDLGKVFKNSNFISATNLAAITTDKHLTYSILLTGEKLPITPTAPTATVVKSSISNKVNGKTGQVVVDYDYGYVLFSDVASPKIAYNVPWSKNNLFVKFESYMNGAANANTTLTAQSGGLQINLTNTGSLDMSPGLDRLSDIKMAMTAPAISSATALVKTTNASAVPSSAEQVLAAAYQSVLQGRITFTTTYYDASTAGSIVGTAIPVEASVIVNADGTFTITPITLTKPSSAATHVEVTSPVMYLSFKDIYGATSEVKVTNFIMNTTRIALPQ